MPDSKKPEAAGQVKKSKELVDPEILYYIRLVNKVRKSTSKVVQNDAFKKISAGLESKIKKIAGKFRIPGSTFEDVYQESLFALRYKAIKDYDQTRGTGEGPAPFDRFALLCIRRHLATTLKTSHQNKKKILNNYKSLDQDRGNDSDELSLVNILPKTSGDICGEIQSKEFFKNVVNKLLSRLSEFEKQVFYLYAHGYTYEEISDLINNKYPHDEVVDIKGVDNALSRIKNKARTIYKRIQSAAGEPALIGKKKYKHLHDPGLNTRKKKKEDVI